MADAVIEGVFVLFILPSPVEAVGMIVGLGPVSTVSKNMKGG